mmetsp:Transcript_30972/g.69704  ORF Transcript_30972/g.69704 Transcript_30972/m.69704 type:complete len:372 (+) Transcript_30972:22-1137(+)
MASDDEVAELPPQAPGAPADADEADDLFGSEAGSGGEEAQDPGPDELFGSDDEGDDADEAELFGSADEAEEEAPPAGQRRVPHAPQAARSEISELDERDVFGDVSDDEPEKELSINVTERMMPPSDRELVSMRLPNVMSVDEEEYRGIDSITDTVMEGYREFKNTRGQNVLRLQNPENCVRWRFEQDEYGNSLLDDAGRQIHESNTRLVQWEDGTWTLYVGNEPFQIDEISDRNPIFEVNSQDVLVCHGTVFSKFITTPKSMESASHDMLKRSQYRKYEPVRRSLLMTETETAEARQVLDMERESRKIRESRQKRAGGDTALPAMTAGFLEDDQAVEGPSIADLKRQYKGDGGRPAKRPKNESHESPSSAA